MLSRSSFPLKSQLLINHHHQCFSIFTTTTTTTWSKTLLWMSFFLLALFCISFLQRGPRPSQLLRSLSTRNPGPTQPRPRLPRSGPSLPGAFPVLPRGPPPTRPRLGSVRVSSPFPDPNTPIFAPPVSLGEQQQQQQHQQRNSNSNIPTTTTAGDAFLADRSIMVIFGWKSWMVGILGIRTSIGNGHSRSIVSISLSTF